jgi:hypothetical protein
LTHLHDVIALATKLRWSPTQLLEHLVANEQQERTRRSLGAAACAVTSAASRR